MFYTIHYVTYNVAEVTSLYNEAETKIRDEVSPPFSYKLHNKLSHCFQMGEASVATILSEGMYSIWRAGVCMHRFLFFFLGGGEKVNEVEGWGWGGG